MTRSTPILAIVAGLLTTACATVPTGPSMMVLPGQGKNFEQFQADDSLCRQWAMQQTGTTTSNASAGSTVSGAVIGTAVGAAAGAALGAAADNPAIGGGRGRRSRPARRHGRRRERWKRCLEHRAAALRHDVHAVHVRQGQSDPGRQGCATGELHRRSTSEPVGQCAASAGRCSAGGCSATATAGGRAAASTAQRVQIAFDRAAASMSRPAT